LVPCSWPSLVVPYIGFIPMVPLPRQSPVHLNRLLSWVSVCCLFSNTFSLLGVPSFPPIDRGCSLSFPSSLSNFFVAPPCPLFCSKPLRVSLPSHEALVFYFFFRTMVLRPQLNAISGFSPHCPLFFSLFSVISLRCKLDLPLNGFWPPLFLFPVWQNSPPVFPAFPSG